MSIEDVPQLTYVPVGRAVPDSIPHISFLQSYSLVYRTYWQTQGVGIARVPVLYRKRFEESIHLERTSCAHKSCRTFRV